MYSLQGLHQPDSQRRRQRVTGVTLIELLVVVTIMAIIGAISAPYFRDILRKNAMEASLAELRSAISFARSEALARGKPVTVCHSADLLDCNTTAAETGRWHRGWIVFLDYATDGVVEDGATGDDQILRVHQALNGSLDLRLREFSGTTLGDSKDFIQFDRNGRLSSAAGNPAQALFQICEEQDKDELSRGMIVHRSGTLQNSRDVDDDGTHNWASSMELDCG